MKANASNTKLGNMNKKEQHQLLVDLVNKDFLDGNLQITKKGISAYKR